MGMNSITHEIEVSCKANIGKLREGQKNLS